MTAIPFFTTTHEIMLGLGIPFILGTFAFLRQRNRCIDRIDKRTLRHSHVFEYMAETNDNDTNRLHPKERINTRDIVGKMLRDENDNL